VASFVLVIVILLQRFGKGLAKNAAILIGLRLDVDGRGGGMQILFPYATLEPIRELLTQSFMGEKLGRDQVWEGHLATEIWQADVTMQAVLHEMMLPLKRVMRLKVGDTLMFDAKPSDLVTVRCGERSATFFIDPALTSDECLQVEQMLTSPSVRIPYGSDVALYDTDFDALIPIIITDFTSELSDTDEKLNSVKFTWRFAENRPKVAVPESPGIFNEKYNPTFS